MRLQLAKRFGTFVNLLSYKYSTDKFRHGVRSSPYKNNKDNFNIFLLAMSSFVVIAELKDKPDLQTTEIAGKPGKKLLLTQP